MSRARMLVKLGEEKRLVKFTLSTMKRYDEAHGESGAALSIMLNSPMVALLGLTYYGLTYERNENKLPAEFDEEMLSEWIDDLAAKDIDGLVGCMMLSVKKFGDAFAKQEEALKRK